MQIPRCQSDEGADRYNLYRLALLIYIKVINNYKIWDWEMKDGKESIHICSCI